MTASSGLSLYPFDGNECTELLDAADSAMYDSKRPAAATSPCELMLRE